MAEFLNRQRHLVRLSELLLAEDTDRVRLVLAVGKEGVGKSTLLRRSASMVSSRYCYVYCDRVPSDDGTLGQRSLSELLERGLSALAPECGFARFDKFHTGGKVKKALKQGSEAVGSIVAKSLLPGLAADFAQETYKKVDSWVGSLKNRGVWHPYKDDHRLMYALKVFQSTRSIVHIDHAENLEEPELEILLHLLDSTDAVIFLEYTSDPEKFSVPKATNGHRALVLKIEPLDKEYAERLFSTLPTRFGALLHQQFSKSGDLRPYDEAAVIYSRDKSIQEIFDITEDALNEKVMTGMERLGQQHRNLLLAIAAHGGPVDLDLLNEFIEANLAGPLSIVIPDTGKALALLDYEMLIILATSDVMCQSRVNQTIQRNTLLSSSKLVFRKLWRDFYRDAPTRNVFVSDEDRHRQLLYQCAELNDVVGISRTLEEVGKRGISTRNPRAIVAYVKSIIGKLSSSAGELVAKRIAEAQAYFFYEAGWFNEALTCLAFVKSTSKRYQLLLAELYCSTEHQVKGIKLANSYLSELDTSLGENGHVELCLNLIKLHGMRSSNRLEDARALYKKCVTEPRYQMLSSYSVLLRFADMCLYKDSDIDDCIVYLRQAVYWTKKRGQPRDYAYACISLAQQLGYTDALDEAESLLAEAEAVTEHVWFQQAPLLANKAVLAIYRNIVERGSIELLQQALVLSYDSLDRILIQVNMLVWYVLAQDMNSASRISSALQVLVKNENVDNEIARIALYNVEQYERLAGNHAAADSVFDRWSAIESGVDDSYWKYRKNKELPNDEAPSRYKMKFYPVYLAPWHIGLVPFEAVHDDV